MNGTGCLRWTFRFGKVLNGLLYLPGAQAPGAHMLSFCALICLNSDLLQVWPEYTFCFVVCVTDVVAGYSVLATHCTYCHRNPFLLKNLH